MLRPLSSGPALGRPLFRRARRVHWCPRLGRDQVRLRWWGASLLLWVAAISPALASVTEIHKGFRALASGSPRVEVETLGWSEGGREILLVRVSDERNLRERERLTSLRKSRLDPRRPRDPAHESAARECPLAYFVFAGLGERAPDGLSSPNLLLEAARALASGESAQARRIRAETVLLLTPVIDPDAHETLRAWRDRHPAAPSDLLPPYAGAYLSDEREADGIACVLASTRALRRVVLDERPQVMHDFRGSETGGHARASRAASFGSSWVDSIARREWGELARAEASVLDTPDREDAPGSSWSPENVLAIALRAGAVGRRSVSPRPTLEGLLACLDFAATHRERFLEDARRKASRAMEAGRRAFPGAWIFPSEPAQADGRTLTETIGRLIASGVEVDVVTAAWSHAGRAFPAGSYVVRQNQPMYPALASLFDPGDRVEAVPVTRTALDGASTRALHAPVRSGGRILGEGRYHLLADSGQHALLSAASRLAGARVDVAEHAFSHDGRAYPAGSWILDVPVERLRTLVSDLGLILVATGRRPIVPSHPLRLGRLGVLHTWTETDAAGWVRAALDRAGVPYSLVRPEDLRRNALGSVDVLLYSTRETDLATVLQGPALRGRGTWAFEHSRLHPALGVPNEAEDVTRGFGEDGLRNLRSFLEDGGTLLAFGTAPQLLVDAGLVECTDPVEALLVRSTNRFLAEVSPTGGVSEVAVGAGRVLLHASDPFHRLRDLAGYRRTYTALLNAGGPGSTGELSGSDAEGPIREGAAIP